jgi:hypothetical protein
MDRTKKSAFVSHKKTQDCYTFTFNTESTYEMPVAILTSEIKQFQGVLTFAAKLIELENSLSTDYIKDTLFAEYVKKLEGQHAADVELIKKNGEDEISSKISGLVHLISEKEKVFSEQTRELHSDYSQQIKNLSREKAKIEDAANATKQEIEANLQKEIKGLRKQLSDKEIELQSASKSETVLRAQCMSESDRLIKIIEEKNTQQIQCLRESYEQSIKLKEEALEQRELRIIQKEKELDTTVHRNASSSFRGQDGEHFFQTLAEEKMKWKLIDTSKTPHSCDYSAIIHKINVFFEMKNYTSDVRSDQITKFLRDMKEHPEVHIGIFISLHTKIAGKDREKPISIEWINDSQCAVYIQSFKELDENHTLSLIDQIIKLSSTYNKMIGSKDTVSEESMLQGRIDKARVYFEEYITETCSLIKRVTNDQKLHRQLVESSYSHTLAVLKTQSSAINTALEILTGEYKEDNTIDDTLICVVDEIKPKRGGKKK